MSQAVVMDGAVAAPDTPPVRPTGVEAPSKVLQVRYERGCVRRFNAVSLVDQPVRELRVPDGTKLVLAINDMGQIYRVVDNEVRRVSDGDDHDEVLATFPDKVLVGLRWRGQINLIAVTIDGDELTVLPRP